MTFAFRARSVILLTILAASLGLTGAVAVASNDLSRAEVAMRAAQLLERAPVLDPRPTDALSERAFMDEVEQLLGEDVDNVGEAIDELEERLKPKHGHNIAMRVISKVASVFGKDDTQKVIGSVDPVRAIVTSVPSNLPVRYYLKTRPKQKLDTVADGPILDLDPPAIWVFECTNNGVLQTRVVTCISGCSVHFTF